MTEAFWGDGLRIDREETVETQGWFRLARAEKKIRLGHLADNTAEQPVDSPQAEEKPQPFGSLGNTPK